MEDTNSCLQSWEECWGLAENGLAKELRLDEVALNVACCLAQTGELPKAREFVGKAFLMSLCADEAHFEAAYPFVEELIF
jgi:hypothetical protein